MKTDAGVESDRLVCHRRSVHRSCRLSFRLSAILIAAAACAVSGCLPAGAPPTGRHVVKDRTLTNVFLSPSEKVGTPSHLLATGPMRPLPAELRSIQYGSVVDLYSFADPPDPAVVESLADVQPLRESLLVSDADHPGRLYSVTAKNVIPTDRLGRLWYVAWIVATGRSVYEKLDLDTKVAEGAGLADVSSTGKSLLFSPGRTRVFTGYALWDVDPTFHPGLGSVESAAFLGEDFYYSSATPGGASNITRILASWRSESVLSSTGNVTFVPLVGDRTPQLLLSLNTLSGITPFGLLDTGTLLTRNLPVGVERSQFVSASSDGHAMLFQALVPGKVSAELLVDDWSSGAQATLDQALVGHPIDDHGHAFRPASHELWFSTRSGRFGIRKSSGAVTTLPGTLVFYEGANSPLAPSPFTPDGGHFFSSRDGQTGRVFVGQADDPNTPAFPLNPSGTTTTRYWQLDGGRLLVEAYPVDSGRNDIYLVDPDTGSTRALAGAGQVVSVGHSRFLALLDWNLARLSGKLTLVDLGSGVRTVLADDVYAVALDRGPSATPSAGTDALAPGTRVAYLFRHRLESPYDGLWVTELP